MAMAMPVGITVRSPALRTTSPSVQAHRSNPALPAVARLGIIAPGRIFFILSVSMICLLLFDAAVEKSARKFALRGVAPAVAFENFFAFVLCLGREPQQREIRKFKLLALVALDHRYAV